MITTAGKNLLAGFIFPRNGTLFNTLWIGWSTTTPNLDGTGVTEPTTVGTGYSRIPVQANNTANGFTLPVDGLCTNQSVLQFAQTTSNLGVATHWVMFSSQTGGVLYFYGALQTPRSVESGTVLIIPVGGVEMQIDNAV